ncbi:MAG: archaeoflavoprotein AfpA [Euryarchaeota archaeon]|nr:archaeoflavoprotein AfpA [Euryarchaeota archaeon]
MNEFKKRKRIVWGITGSGDRIRDTVDVMKEMKEKYEDRVDIRVYVSKAGDQVVKYYKLLPELEIDFDKIWVEANANAPFLAGQVQMGKFEFMLIAPATSNTVAKISLRIADTMLTNAAIMSQKALVPLYIMPSDFKEGEVITKLPNGKDLKLVIRKEDVEHVQKLAAMEGVSMLERTEDIPPVFEKYFGL